MAYTKGRQKGRKNLKKTAAGTLINQHGVEFTPDEKRALENAVNRVNRLRNQMLKEAATLPRSVLGKQTGETVGDLQRMGQESDFIIAKRTKSMQRFTSREQFEKALKSMGKINRKDYLDDRIRAYKRNYTKALDNVYSTEETGDIKMRIRMMKPRDFMKLVQQEGDTLEISYHYLPSDQSAKLNQIRQALGLKQKEIPFDE